MLGPNWKWTPDPGNTARPSLHRITLLKWLWYVPVQLQASAACDVMFPNSCRTVRLSVWVCNKERVMAAGAPVRPMGQSGEEQTVVSFHWKHMVKLKCVIYLRLRVARVAHTHMHTRTRAHIHTHWQGVIYLGPMGGPVSCCTCHTHGQLKHSSHSLTETQREWN